MRERTAFTGIDSDLVRRIERRAAKLHLEVNHVLAHALSGYYELLQRWNTKINLTALTATDEAVDRLLLEPVLAARVVADATTVMDLGSGGGSPAIPLKLAVPHLSLLMVESKTRKAAFLREAVRHLALTGASVEAARFEDLLGNPQHVARYDVLTMRAVRCDAGTLSQLARLARPGGRFLLFTTETEIPLLFDTGGWHLLGSEPLLPTYRTRLAVFRRDA